MDVKSVHSVTVLPAEGATEKYVLYVRMCVCMYIHAHTHTHIHIYTHMHMHDFRPVNTRL